MVGRIESVKIFLLIVLCVFVYYFLPLPQRLLWQPDETRYAEISREMLTRGNWIVPYFLDLRYFEKPVLGYWINNLGQLLFGHNNFGVRAGSVLSTLITGGLITWLTWRMWHNLYMSITAGIIYITFLIVYGIGTYAVLDPMINLCLTATMCGVWWTLNNKGWRKVTGWMVVGLTIGAGIMTKGFLAVVVPAVSLLPWLTMQNRWKDVLIGMWLVIFSSAIIVLPWALAIHYQEPDFWRWFFWVEHVQRFFGSNAQHKAPFWFYLPIFLAGALPWLGFLPGTLLSGWKQRKTEPNLCFLMCFTLMPLILFSLANGKLLTYILPCFVPLSVLMAHYLNSLPVNASSLRINGWINTGFGVLGTLLTVLVISPWGVYPLYTDNEQIQLLGAVVVFVLWGMTGIAMLIYKQKNVHIILAPVCLLGLVLLVGTVIPEKIQNTKQPQKFIELVRETLQDGRYILVQNSGVASAIAWELQRSDIILFEDMGELEYGLTYLDADEKYVGIESFTEWLNVHRQIGSVIVVLYLPDNDSEALSKLPIANRVRLEGRFVLLEYDVNYSTTNEVR